MDGQLQYMLSQGCEVHVAMPKDFEYTPQLIERENGVSFHYVPFKREVSVLRDIKCLFRIYFLIHNIKPDILHLHTPKASFIGALAGRLAFQRNIIYQMHGLISASGDLAKKRGVYYFEKATCFLATNVFAVSQSIREFAVANDYCANHKISVIGHGTINGIDSERRFNKAKISKCYKYLNPSDLEDKFVIGFIGRINRDKGIEDFLKVIINVASKIPVLAIVVGRNEMQINFNPFVERFKAEASNSDLHILSQIPDPERIMCHLNVLLFPTRREGFGLVAAEANSLEVPVIAYDIPGVRDAVDNDRTGKLVPFNDLMGIEAAILDYYFHRDKLHKHGVNGRRRVQELYSREVLWRSILETYRNVLNG